MSHVDELRTGGVGYTAKEVLERLGVKDYILNRYIHMLQDKGYPVSASGTQFRFYSEDLVRCLHELIVLDEHGMDLEAVVNTIMVKGTVGEELIDKLSDELKGMYVLEEAADLLGVEKSELQILSRRLESLGYVFKRNNKRYRIYTEKDFRIMRKGHEMYKNGWMFPDIAEWLMFGCSYSDMTKIYTDSAVATKLGVSKDLVTACIQKLKEEGKIYKTSSSGKIILSGENIDEIEKEVKKENKVREDAKNLCTVSDVATRLGLNGRSVLSLYASTLEKAGYVFTKNLSGRRFYSERDIELVAELRKQGTNKIRLLVVAKTMVNPQALTDMEKLDVNRIENSAYKLKDIGEVLGIKPPNVSRYVNYLEDAGYDVQRDSRGNRVYTEELVQMLIEMQKLHVGGVQVKRAAKQVMEDRTSEE